MTDVNESGDIIKNVNGALPATSNMTSSAVIIEGMGMHIFEGLHRSPHANQQYCYVLG